MHAFFNKVNHSASSCAVQFLFQKKSVFGRQPTEEPSIEEKQIRIEGEPTSPKNVFERTTLNIWSLRNESKLSAYLYYLYNSQLALKTVKISKMIILMAKPCAWLDNFCLLSPHMPRADLSTRITCLSFCRVPAISIIKVNITSGRHDKGELQTPTERKRAGAQHIICGCIISKKRRSPILLKSLIV